MKKMDISLNLGTVLSKTENAAIEGLIEITVLSF